MMTSNIKLIQSMKYPTIIQTEDDDIVPEQAIILDNIADATVEEYNIALKQIIGPSKIYKSGKISNDRICIYLDSIAAVDELVESHKSVTVSDINIPIRPFVTRNKRIIISCQPFITDRVLELIFEKYDVKPMSPITSLRAGFRDKELSHVGSFRRQVYLTPEDATKLPPGEQIIRREKPHWIFFSSDKVTCFECQLDGHIARYCPNKQEALNRNNAEKIVNTTSNTTSLLFPAKDYPSLPIPRNQTVTETITHSQNNPIVSKNSFYPLFSKPSKRRHAPSTISSSTPSKIGADDSASVADEMDEDFLDTESIISTNSQANTSTENVRPSKKKVKRDSKSRESTTQAELDWQEVKDLMELPEMYPLNFEQLQSFFNSIHGVKEIKDIALQHTNDLGALITLLTDVHDVLPSKSLKNRSTRIVKKLENILKKPIDEDASQGLNSGSQQMNLPNVFHSKTSGVPPSTLPSVLSLPPNDITSCPSLTPEPSEISEQYDSRNDADKFSEEEK